MNMTRWRGTKVINVSMFSVRRIVVAEGDRPAVTLLYNPDNATWTGSVAGHDVTAQLDRARANKLLQRLQLWDKRNEFYSKLSGGQK